MLVFTKKLIELTLIISKNQTYFFIIILKYNLIASYRNAMPAKRKENPSDNTTKHYQVYNSPKPISNKVN